MKVSARNPTSSKPPSFCNGEPMENVEKKLASLPHHTSVTVTVDAKRQELRKLRQFTAMFGAVPSVLPPAAQFVLTNLMSCFNKSQNVSEGLIGDILFGFEASGIPTEQTLQGLHQLERAGFVRFQAKDGTYVDISSDLIGSAFVRYQPLLLDLVFSSDS